MNKTETAQIMAVLQAAFPAYYRDCTPEDAQIALNLWAEMFEDDPAYEVAAAVKCLISTQTQGFPPTIGAVKEKLSQLRDPNRMTSQAAWTLAAKAAAGNLAWDKLPALVQQAIGDSSILRSWGLVDMDTFNTVIYSQFLKAYGVCDKRRQEMESLPESVRTLVSAAAERLALHE